MWVSSFKHWSNVGVNDRVITYLSFSNLFHFFPDTAIEHQSEDGRLHICWNRKNESTILFAWIWLEKCIAEIGLVKLRIKSHPASIGSVSNDHFFNVKGDRATVFYKRQSQRLLD
jgi:hypothetical protein